MQQLVQEGISMMVNGQVAEQEPDQALEQDRIRDFHKEEVQEWVVCKWEEFLQEWLQARHLWEAQWVARANNKIHLVVPTWVAEVV